MTSILTELVDRESLKMHAYLAKALNQIDEVLLDLHIEALDATHLKNPHWSSFLQNGFEVFQLDEIKAGWLSQHEDDQSVVVAVLLLNQNIEDCVKSMVLGLDINEFCGVYLSEKTLFLNDVFAEPVSREI